MKAAFTAKAELARKISGQGDRGVRTVKNAGRMTISTMTLGSVHTVG